MAKAEALSLFKLVIVHREDAKNAKWTGVLNSRSNFIFLGVLAVNFS